MTSIDTASAPGSIRRARFARLARLGAAGRMRGIALAAVVLVAVPVALNVGPGTSSSALGPVVAITPDQTSRPVINGFEPDISWRGETVGVSSIDPSLVTFVDRTNGGPEGSVDGQSIGISGNGCVAVSVRPRPSTPVFTIPPIIVNPPIVIPLPTLPPIIINSGPNLLQQVTSAQQSAVAQQSAQQAIQMQIVRTDRCTPSNSGVIGETDSSEQPFSQIAVDFDGDVAVIPSRNVVRYIDTSNGIDTNLPLNSIAGGAPAVVDGASFPAFGEISTNVVDVSANGDVVVATMRAGGVEVKAPAAILVVSWNVGSPNLEVLSTADGSATGIALHPSISADGAFVSFISIGQSVGQLSQVPNRYLVVVRPRSTPTFTPISDPARQSLFTSLSADGSQVAYATVGPDSVPQIEVAWSSTPGLTGSVQREVVNASASGIIGQHGEVALSGSGRYVTWQTNGAEALIGRAFDGATHVVLRARDAAMTVGSVDFGSVPEGTSKGGAATVTNTGTSSLMISSVVSTGAPFVVVGPGSCVLGGWLAPGASCAVDVRFDAPPGGGSFNAELLVAETGFEALRASGRLLGVSVPKPTISTTLPPPTTTTRPTTTLPPTTTTQPTTTTTIPGVVVLTATPDPLDFGDVSVGIPTAPKAVVVTNEGTAVGTLTVAIGGDDAADFEVVADGCSAVSLAVDATCTVSIRLVASDGGSRTATLTVTSGSGAGAVSTTVQLIGDATFNPRLIASPDAVSETGITLLVGQGFPFDDLLTIAVGDDLTLDVATDDTGAFQLPFEVFGRLPLGSYEVRTTSADGLFDDVVTPLLVVLDSFQPQGPTSPVFGNNLLVSR